MVYLFSAKHHLCASQRLEYPISKLWTFPRLDRCCSRLEHARTLITKSPQHRRRTDDQHERPKLGTFRQVQDVEIAAEVDRAVMSLTTRASDMSISSATTPRMLHSPFASTDLSDGKPKHSAGPWYHRAMQRSTRLLASPARPTIASPPISFAYAGGLRGCASKATERGSNSTKHWTTSEVDTLQRMRSEGCSKAEIGLALNKTTSSVSTKWYRLNGPKSNENPPSARTFKPWTESEIDTVLQMWNENSITKIALKLGRTEDSVRSKWGDLREGKCGTYKYFLPTEDRKLEQLRDSGMKW